MGVSGNEDDRITLVILLTLREPKDGVKAESVEDEACQEL
jgi:hypothetical protein